MYTLTRMLIQLNKSAVKSSKSISSSSYSILAYNRCNKKSTYLNLNSINESCKNKPFLASNQSIKKTFIGLYSTNKIDDELHKRIEKVVKTDTVVVFMKGII
jgi:hypothetical protein